AEAVLGAAPLRRPEFDDVKERLEWRDEVTEAEAWSCVRTAIELFYREPVTAALVALDDEGRYRQAVKRFGSIGFAHDCDHVRAAIACAGEEPLDPRARFVKTPRDVAGAIMRMLHHTPLMRDGALGPDVTLTKDDLA